MKENFLRPPHGALEYTADGIRVLGLLGFVAAAIWLQPTDAGILAFALPAIVAPRFLGVRAGFDAIFCAVVLLAAWSNVIDLYRTIAAWDIVMHAVTMAVLVPLAYLLLARARILPTTMTVRIAIVLYPLLGLALGALWEMVEWAGFTFISGDIYVEYNDTIGDMAVGALGAFVAGALQGGSRLERDASNARRAPADPSSGAATDRSRAGATTPR